MAPIDDARREAQKAEQKIVEFFTAVDDLLSRAAPTTAPSTPGVSAAGGPAAGPVLVAPELVEEVRCGAEQVGREFRAVFDRLAVELEQGGDSDRLRHVATGWTRLANDIGATAATVGLERMHANIEWEGAAQRAYVATVPAQGANLATVKTACLQLAGSLNGLADGIDAYWLAVKVAIVAFLAAIAICIASVFTGPGFAGGVAIVLGAIAGLWALLGSAIMPVATLTARIATEQRTTVQTLADLGHTWPAPNLPDLADASVTDGDDTRWKAGR